MTPLTAFLISILSGAIGATLAHRRGRSIWAWFFIGLFFGLIGVLFLFILPRLKDGRPLPRGMPTVLDANTGPVENADTPTPIKEETVADPLVWHYLDAAHQPQEPVSLRGLADLWRTGSISGKTYVWTTGMNEWKEIDSLPELKSQVRDNA